MKYTVTLPDIEGISAEGAKVGVVTEWHKEIGEAVLSGDTLATVGRAAIRSSAYGILARKFALPGEAIEVGEPLALLSGVPEPLTTGTEAIPLAFQQPSYLPTGPENKRSLTEQEQAIAQHNLRSAYYSPRVTSVLGIDMEETIRLSERVNAPLLLFVAHVAAAALTKFPRLNSRIVDDAEIIEREYIHIAIPFRTSSGTLFTVVLRDADSKSLMALTRESEVKRLQAEEGVLPADGQRGATFTIADAAPVLYQTPVLHQPQAALLTVGTVVRTPVALPNDTVVVRPISHLCLTHDARFVPNEDAAAFLAEVKTGLEEARFLFA